MGNLAGALARYPSARDASRTSWQPDSARMEDLRREFEPWSTMLHGYDALVYDDQGGPRGVNEIFSESMGMGMARRRLGARPRHGTRRPLEPSARDQAFRLRLLRLSGPTRLWSHHLHAPIFRRGKSRSAHRSPLAGFHPRHVWDRDGRLVYDAFKIEASRFTGREPDQHRYDFDAARFASWSVRGTWNPTANLSMQVSHGHLVSPEQLTSNINQDRNTASATYNLPLKRGDWQTTIAWGRDVDSPGRATDAFLVESAASQGRHTLFGRAETVDKDELFINASSDPLNDRSFKIHKFSLGYFYTLPIENHLGLELDGLLSKYALPSALDASYGSSPTSFMLFARMKLE